MTDLEQATKKCPKFTLEGLTVWAKIVDCYDGDTVQAVFRTFDGQPLYRYSCRMIGYDCAEIRSKNSDEKASAQKAKSRITELVLNKIVTLKIGPFDKYGRILVELWCDDCCVNQKMIEEGLGVPYNGTGSKFAEQVGI
jgi:micrococcal nuclease